MPIQVGIMHVQRVKSKRGSKTYEQILLRESYREPGAKRSAVKKRTLLNLTKYPPQIVQALELALKHQGDLSALTAMRDIALEQGPAVGAVFTLLEVARRLGIEKALGTHQNGKTGLVASDRPGPFPGLAAFRRAAGQNNGRGRYHRLCAGLLRRQSLRKPHLALRKSGGDRKTPVCLPSGSA